MSKPELENLARIGKLAAEVGQSDAVNFIGNIFKSPTGVIPAKAGIQLVADLPRLSKPWIPAFAGMTAFYSVYPAPSLKTE